MINQLRLEKKQLELELGVLEVANKEGQKEIEQLLEMLEEKSQEREREKEMETGWVEEKTKREEKLTKYEKELEAANLMVYELNEFIKSMK